MIRPPQIILSEAVKDFIKKNRHPKLALQCLVMGKKKKDAWHLEEVIELSQGWRPSICPNNIKPFKDTLLRKKHITGIIHAHPEETTIPSKIDLKKHPVNKLVIILGRDAPSYWWKHANHLIEVKP